MKKMKKLLVVLTTLFLLTGCFEKEEITPELGATHELTFTCSPSADIWWGIGELKFMEKSGGYFEKSLTIHSGQNFYLRIEAPHIAPTRTVEIFIDDVLKHSEQMNDKTIIYKVK